MQFASYGRKFGGAFNHVGHEKLMPPGLSITFFGLDRVISNLGLFHYGVLECGHVYDPFSLRNKAFLALKCNFRAFRD